MAQATENKPLLFFQHFFSSDNIEKLKEEFYPNQDDEFNRWHNLPVTIDKENESFTAEYLVVTNNDDYSSDDWSPLYQWETRVYTFLEYLDNYLKREYLQARDFLERNLSNRPNRYKAGYFVESEIRKCLDLISLVNSTEPFSKYSVCVKPMQAIIRYLYAEHRSIVPKATNEIKNILQKSERHTQLYVPNTLKSGIAREIFELRDPITSERTFFDEEVTNEEKRNLKSFIRSDFQAMLGPVIIKKNKLAFHYLLHQLSIRGDGPKPVAIESSKMIKFGNDNFQIERHYTYHQRFGGKNTRLKSQIDQLISNNLI